MLLDIGFICRNLIINETFELFVLVEARGAKEMLNVQRKLSVFLLLFFLSFSQGLNESDRRAFV